jgi:hypothetical protein
MNKPTQELIENLIKMNEVNGNLSRSEVDTFIFCFLLILYLEKIIEKSLCEALLDALKSEAKDPELVNLLIKERYFGEKIEIFERTIEGSTLWERSKDFISICKNVNYDIRNNLFHFKLNELKYRNSNVSNTEIQNKIITDLISAEAKIKQDEEPVLKQNEKF